MSEPTCMIRHIRPNMFIGTGPGRCGTKSLARILNELPGVKCWHEHYFRVKHYNTLDVQRMFALFTAHPAQLTGEVGVLWLMFIPLLRLQFPLFPVVCLHRPKDEVVESFSQRIKRRNKPWLLNLLGRVDQVTPDFFAAHWEWAEGQMKQIGPPVHHMEVNDLNDDGKLNELCDFLEIPEAQRRFPTERKHNVGLAAYDELGQQVAKGKLKGHERVLDIGLGNAHA